MRRYVAIGALAIVISAATMLVPYEYCMDGPGRGFPFAVYCPACGAWLSVFAFDESKIPMILDLGGFLGDVFAWGLAMAFVHFRLIPRLRSLFASPQAKPEI